MTKADRLIIGKMFIVLVGLLGCLLLHKRNELENERWRKEADEVCAQIEGWVKGGV